MAPIGACPSRLAHAFQDALRPHHVSAFLIRFRNMRLPEIENDLVWTVPM
jgi:hypothetical protein